MLSNRLQPILLKTIKLGLYLSLLTPLVFWDRVIYPFLFPKVIFFRVIVEILLILYIILCVREPIYRPRATPLLIAIGLYVAIAALTSIIGSDAYLSFFSTLARGDGVTTLIHMFIYCIILTSVLRTKDEWVFFFYIFSLVFFLENIIALGQIFKIPFVKTFGSERPNGSLGNPAYFASYLLLGIWISLFLFSARAKNKRMWFLSIIFICNIILGIINMNAAVNRASILGLLSGCALFALLQMFSSPKKFIKKYCTKITLLFFIIFIVLIFLSPASNSFGKLIHYSMNDPSIANRIISWNIGWRAFLEKPIFGWGNENYAYVFNVFFDPKIIRDAGSFSWFDRAHNTIIEILVANGIFGAIVYVGIFIISIYLLTKSNLKNIEKNIFISLLASYFIQGIFIFDTITTSMLFFSFVAYIDTCSKNPKIHAYKEIHEHNSGKKLKISHAFGIFAIAVAAYFINIQPTIAAFYASKMPLNNALTTLELLHYYKKAFLLSPAKNFELREALALQVIKKLTDGEDPNTMKPLIVLAIDSLKKSADANPKNVSLGYALAELERLSSTIDPSYLSLAEKDANKTFSVTTKRHQPYFTLGKIRFQQNKKNEGIEYFKKVLKINPNFTGAHWNLIIAYFNNDESDLANNEIQFLQEHDPGFVYSEKNISILTRLFAEKGQYANAISLYFDALGFGFYAKPEYFEALSSLYQLAGNNELSEKAKYLMLYLKEKNIYETNRPFFLQKLGEFFRAAGRVDLANEVLAQEQKK